MSERTERLTITKGQLKQLVELIDGTDFQTAYIEPISVEGKTGLLVSYSSGVGTRESTQHKVLVIGSGAVRL